MDAFFAAIEERDRPRLQGLPIVVGADPYGGAGRGVVSTANYKAREYGIHSAMSISQAWRLAEEGRRKGGPETVFLSGNYSHYGQVSREIMQIIETYTPIMEQASVDEAYFDLSHHGSFEAAREACLQIQAAISKEQKLTASLGLAPNKMIAKIASDMHKPNGLTVVTEQEAEEFLARLSIRKIPGIGPKTEEVLGRIGVILVGDLKKFTQDQLQALLGKWGVSLYFKARGIDDSPITQEHEAKSIGEQETFMRDTRDANEVIELLRKMCASIIRSLSDERFSSFRSVCIIVRFSDFETKTRIHTLSQKVSSPEALEFEALRLLMPFFDKRENPKLKSFRLFGVRIGKLE